MEIYLTMVP